MHLSFVHITTVGVGEYLPPGRVRHYNSTVRPANWAPDYVGTSIGHSTIVDDNGSADALAEVQRRVSHDVVYGIVGAVGGGVANWQFVYEDPFLDRWDVCHNRHTRASKVFFVGYIVDNRAPGFQVGRRLVGKLLAVLGVTLIRVVGDQLALILSRMLSIWRSQRYKGEANLQQVWLPDWGCSIGSVGPSTLGNMAHKLPRPRPILARI